MQNLQTVITNKQNVFRDVAKIRNGYAFKKTDFIKSGVPLIRQSNLDGERVDLSGCVFLSESYLEKYPNFVLKKGDVLLGMSGSLGKLCYYNLDEPALQNQRTGKIDITHPEKVTERYFWYFLNTIESKLIGLSKGTGVNNVSATDIESLGIYLPALDDQNKITHKLDNYIPKVEASNEKINKVKKLLRKFRQSVLSAAVTGKLTEEWRTNKLPQTKNESVEVDNFPFEIPSSWRLLKIEDIAEYMGGYAYKSTTFLKQGTNQVIRIGNVKQLNIFLDYSPVYIPETIAEETQRFSLQTNDILLSMTGTKYKRDYGFACIVPELDDKELFLNQRVACLRLKTGIPEYLLYYFQTDFFRNYLFEGETGNVNQGNVGSTALRVIPIALPPKEEQEEIVKRIKSMFETADLVEKQIEIASKRTNKLTQSILAKAFKGEL